MENQAKTTGKSSFKLNYKRTFLIGFAFFGILLLWQVYDSWCPTFLTELFKEALHSEESTEVQYLVGIMMALDNLAALILLPIFGRLSDKTHTRIGKRMPYILAGTFVCAVSFPFVPVLFHYHNLAGVIAMMAIIVTFSIPVAASSGKFDNPFPVWIYVIWFFKGFGMSLVHVNSYPMVVELCTGKKVGAYTGYYYASSMAAQTITPIALGALLFALGSSDAWKFLPLYAAVCLGISFLIFLFIKNVKSTKTEFKYGLEGIGADED
jgi:MFS family permease